MAWIASCELQVHLSVVNCALPLIGCSKQCRKLSSPLLPTTWNVGLSMFTSNSWAVYAASDAILRCLWTGAIWKIHNDLVTVDMSSSLWVLLGYFYFYNNGFTTSGKLNVVPCAVRAGSLCLASLRTHSSVLAYTEDFICCWHDKNRLL